MNEEDKKTIIQDLNIKIGGDINHLTSAHDLEDQLVLKRDRIQSCLHVASHEVPTKLHTTIIKAEKNSKEIDDLRVKSEQFKKKVEHFLKHTEPLRQELNQRFSTINKLEGVLAYLTSLEKINELSHQLKNCDDDEQAVLLYSEIKDMCVQYRKGHRANYMKECTHYWHNVLKEKLSKQYEDVLKLLKWPLTTAAQNSPASKEIVSKFNNLTKYLFLIEEPECIISTDAADQEERCLPVKILLQPIKKRFTFHFTGSRQTARIDRPEWFLTQTLTWIKDHQTFVSKNVQPIADKLQLKNVKAVDEFNTGLIALAAERLHVVLGLYLTQEAKGEIVDVDAAFAHAVDETLGFHRELVTVTGKDSNTVLSVLTKAETFVRWLSVEKKYALAKMDETLGNEQWSEPIAAGVGAAVGSLVWVPRGADWFIALLKTIEDRYTILPQPGHRLQFLELQLELVEEWRIRLTQLLGAAAGALHADTFLATHGAPHLLIAVINAAHHTRAVLLQWAHSLHYLQLHYYRRQFQHFTQQQHCDEESESSSSSEEDDDSDDDPTKSKSVGAELSEALSFDELELQAKKLALNEVSRNNSLIHGSSQFDIISPIANLAVTEPLSAVEAVSEAEEAGVFGEAPALLAHLRDAGLAAIGEHMLLELKATLRDYKNQKWHAMLTVEEQALCVSPALCAPLAALCARLAAAQALLAPPLSATLRARLAHHVDAYIFEEIVLVTWFNTGGTIQFIHDVKRNLVPAFAPPNKVASQVNQLPKLLETCKLLNLDYEDARRLRALLSKQASSADEALSIQGIDHIQPLEALQILSQRTDLNETSSPSSVMELF